ncbi:MAG: hypothetical protein WC708_01055 [Lentisphaeria bacterium]|jgi:hypothetical protein
MANDEVSQDRPKSKFIRIISYIVSIKELVLAVVAIVTALVGWFKPQDMKVTKASYEILVNRTNEIAKATESNHDDIQSLRSYLDGYTKGEARKIATLVSPAPSASSTLTPLFFSKPTVKNPPFNAMKNNVNQTPAVKMADMSEAPEAPTDVLPGISPRPASAAPPPFAQVEATAK